MEALPHKVMAEFGAVDELRAALDDAKRIGEQAVCFALGCIDHTVALTAIPELCRLPYQTCWFEAEFQNEDDPTRRVCVGMLCSEEEGGFNAAVFARHTSGWWVLAGVVHADSLQDNEMLVQCPAVDGARRQMHVMTYGVKAFLSALHCTNVRRQEHVPDAKLQKARAKRGKSPLFSYWTLQLDGRCERGHDHGGTHASPRVHLRRGHPRQYAPGKWTWVQAHAVGNRAAGVVHKDYRAGAALVGAAL